MNATVGDCFVYASDPGHLVIYISQKVHRTITVYPNPTGTSWTDFTEKICRPALLAEGWSLSNWHRPRGNQAVLCNAVVWRT